MKTEPVETTLYSLSDAPPSVDCDRRDGQRHMTLYRVGSILVEDRRELCLIKNISAGGMMIRLYCSISEGTEVTIELKNSQPISGKISWVRDQNAGIAFDHPVDVFDILSNSMDGPRPRMPRVETDGWATLRDGSNALTVRVRDISQGGVRVACETLIPQGTDVVVGLAGLEPQPGIVCWCEGGFTGIAFNRLIPLGELTAWLHQHRQEQRRAG